MRATAEALRKKKYRREKHFHELTVSQLGTFTVVFTQNTDEQGNVISESQEFRDMFLPEQIKRWQAEKVKNCNNAVHIPERAGLRRAFEEFFENGPGPLGGSRPIRNSMAPDIL